jgi:hypothetical protein
MEKVDLKNSIYLYHGKVDGYEVALLNNATLIKLPESYLQKRLISVDLLKLFLRLKEYPVYVFEYMEAGVVIVVILTPFRWNAHKYSFERKLQSMIPTYLERFDLIIEQAKAFQVDRSVDPKSFLTINIILIA